MKTFMGCLPANLANATNKDQSPQNAMTQGNVLANLDTPEKNVTNASKIDLLAQKQENVNQVK